METKRAIPKTPARFLWFVTKPYRRWAFSALIFSAAAAAFSQGSYYFFKLIIEAAERGDLDRALLYGLAYPVAMFAIQLLFRTSGYFGARWVTNARRHTYEQLVGYTLHHSHNYYSNRFGGSILSKVNNVVEAVDSFVIDLLWTHLTAFVSFLVTFVLIWTVDPLASGIFVALIVVLLVLNRSIAERKQVLSHEAAARATELRGFIVDLFTNAAAVRQYARTKQEERGLAQHTQKTQAAQQANWLYTEYMLFVNVSIIFVFALALFYVLIMRWYDNAISLGDFILVLSLVADLSGTLVFIGRAVNSTARSLGEAREGLDDLLVLHEIADKEGVSVLTARNGQITFDRVSFTYDAQRVFSDLSLLIEPGQRVGLVGPSGAGKSTFVSLLLRQHELGGGSICIDEQDISQVTQDSLRETIAVVPQEPLLFHRSIRENIAYGKPDATQEEIEAVAQKAQAHDFISALPQEYDTLVGERGVKLSGGQRQRVAIARAMLKNSPILVLDEATSSLDSESEAAIQKALHILMEGKTVIAIAHRLSTLREMDRIIVLDGGRIVEDGTHHALVAKGGLYASLWAHQAGGFLQE